MNIGRAWVQIPRCCTHVHGQMSRWFPLSRFGPGRGAPVDFSFYSTIPPPWPRWSMSRGPGSGDVQRPAGELPFQQVRFLCLPALSIVSPPLSSRLSRLDLVDPVQVFPKSREGRILGPSRFACSSRLHSLFYLLVAILLFNIRFSPSLAASHTVFRSSFPGFLRFVGSSSPASTACAHPHLGKCEHSGGLSYQSETPWRCQPIAIPHTPAAHSNSLAPPTPSPDQPVSPGGLSIYRR